MKKLLLTVNIGNWAPEITNLTYPLLRRYAHKIGAEFRVVTERKFPDWPPEVEKLQAYELGCGYDWVYVIDGDTLIQPDMIDPTFYMHFDTVAHNGNDHSTSRWTPNNYMMRDGRGISSCNWFTIGSGWCLDFWHPPDWTTPDEARTAIHLAVAEINAQMFGDRHLTDDYLMSCNLARFGLKFTTIDEIRKKNLMIEERGPDGKETGRKVPMGPWLWHAYQIPRQEKIRQMRDVLRFWGIERYVDELREKYGAVDKATGEIPLERRLAVERVAENEDEVGIAR